MNKIYFILFLFLLIPFTPKLGSVDVIGPQWFLFSICNLFFLIFNYFFVKKEDLFFTNSLLLKNYCFYILLILISILYSVNRNLTLHDIARDINVFLLLLNLLYYQDFKKLNFLFVSLVFSFILFLEVIFIDKPIFNDFLNDGLGIFNYSAIYQNAFLGITGNKNITAASIVMKLPFLFFVFYRTRNIFILLAIFLLTSVITFDLAVLSARASLLSFVFIAFSFLGFLIYKSLIKKGLLLFLSFSLGIYLSIVFIPTPESNALNRLSSIELTNESSSFRLELWEDAFSYIRDKIFYGSGRGSWKVESAQFWSEHGKEYLVPYHAHNDFLEIATELGWLGMLTYLLIFILGFFILFKNYFYYKSSFAFIVFLVLSSYFVDAFFNFPLERPIMQISFIITLFLIIYFELSNKASDA